VTKSDGTVAAAVIGAVAVIVAAFITSWPPRQTHEPATSVQIASRGAVPSVDPKPSEVRPQPPVPKPVGTKLAPTGADEPLRSPSHSGGRGPAEETPTTTRPSPEPPRILTAVSGDVQYDVVSCHRVESAVRCRLRITNRRLLPSFVNLSTGGSALDKDATEYRVVEVALGDERARARQHSVESVTRTLQPATFMGGELVFESVSANVDEFASLELHNFGSDLLFRKVPVTR
jgi:hypothetical protein